MMKKLLPLIVIAVLLAGCSMLTGQQPTESDADMATKVAQILTAQPSPTTAVEAPTADDKILPTVVKTQAPTQPAATEPPATSVPATAAPTLAPTEPAATEPPATSVPATAAPTEPAATVVPTAGPTPTAVPGDPRDAFGAPSFTDKMDTSDNWPTGEDKYTAVTFRDGMMLLTALTDTDGWRLLTYGSVTNFYAEVTARFESCSGSDHFGIFARVPDKNPADRGYLVGISCDGKYRIAEWDGAAKPKGVWTSHVYWTANSAILAGADKTNRIGLLAEGDVLTLYINGAKVDTVKDNTFTAGYLGLFVGADNTNNLTVQVDEMKVWLR